MGTSESNLLTAPQCCKAAPLVRIQKFGDEDRQPCEQYDLGLESHACTHWSHVESLLAHLPPDVHAALEDEAFQKRCHETFQEIQNASASAGSEAFLEGDQLIEAVHRSVPEKFLRDRLHETNLAKLALAFDADCDGRVSEEEFDLFCMWVVAMDVMGFFAGTTPFATIADVIGQRSSTNLLIVSEFLDPDHVLERCSLPSTLCTYYHPDGLTLDEFSAQIKSAAHVRASSGKLFQSVALANHGPDESGLWNVCSDHPVSLRSTDTAWPRLMPFFSALAAMVAEPGQKGCVDLLACNFAATSAGRGCIQMIERQVNARFSASTDATGNVAHGGNWELEIGERNVAPVYFYEEKLHEFVGVMAPASVKKKQTATEAQKTLAAASLRSMGGSPRAGGRQAKYDQRNPGRKKLDESMHATISEDIKGKASRPKEPKPPVRKKERIVERRASEDFV